MTLTPAAERLREAIREIYSPIDRRLVSQWCEDELILSEKQTQTPGKLSLSLTPYLREPLDCFGNSDVTDIVLVFGTQTGKTTLMQAGTAWRIVNKPSPVIWVMPNERLAWSFSKTRWMPICEDSPAVRRVMLVGRSKSKTLEQFFERCSLVFVGSNSPANLASRPAGLLIMDETDKFANETERETNALFLAENRTKSFANALRVKASTPTIPEGIIWTEYLKGTQEKYMLECPHCCKRIELLWEQVKWSGKSVSGRWDLVEVERSAHYECQLCGGKINDGHKLEMLQTGIWQATNKDALLGFRSFHLSSLYSPWRSCSFGALAIKYLQNHHLLSGKQDFYNSTLALPFEYYETSLTDEDILALRGEYIKGECPIEADVVLLGADVGQDKTHWVVTAFDRDANMAVIDYGTCIQVDDLLRLRNNTYANGSLKITGGLIDSGYQTYRVYSVCKSSANLYHAAKGVSVSQVGAKISETVVQDFPGVVLYLFSDHAVKTELFLDRVKRRSPNLWVPKDSSEDFLRGLSGQRLVIKKTPSGKDYVWKSIAYDHYMDSLKLCLVAHKIIMRNRNEEVL